MISSVHNYLSSDIQVKSNLYLPLKILDTLVDKYGSSLPFYQGYSHLNPHFMDNEGHLDSVLMSRFDRHNKICISCTHAYRVTKLVKHILVGVAIAGAVLAILTDDT